MTGNQLLTHSGNDPAFAKALNFIETRQQTDGSWRETPPQQADTPPWADPASESANVYISANCGYWMGIQRPLPEAAQQANCFLRNCFQARKVTSFLQAYWLACGLAVRLEDKTFVQFLTDYLSTKIRELPSSNLAWMLSTLLESGVKPDHDVCQEASSRLQSLQQEDGRWQGEEVVGSDAHTTVESLRALRLAGYI
jgi:hypothetical protein